MLISCFMVCCFFLFCFVFANDLILAVYFIFILAHGNDVDKKQIGAIFLFKFKMGLKGDNLQPQQYIWLRNC